MKRGWFSIALFAVAEIGFGALTYYFANHAANPCIYNPSDTRCAAAKC